MSAGGYGTYDAVASDPFLDLVTEALAHVAQPSPNDDAPDEDWTGDYDKLPDSHKSRFVKQIMKSVSEVIDFGNGVEQVVSAQERKNLLEFLIRKQRNWNVLALSEPLDNDKTPLHGAIEVDIAAKRRKKAPNFSAFLCDLMADGIAANELSKDEAARIVSQTDKHKATCLHLALMKDMPDVSVKLIRLADRRTFERCRDPNGNTPLHDAVDFRFNVLDQVSAARFLIQAPRCQTAALQTPMAADFLTLLSTRASSEKAKASENGEKTSATSSCCERCLAIDNHYQRHKADHSNIICGLLNEWPSALKIANKAGEPPYVYHVRVRDEYRKAHPETDEKVHEILQNEYQQPKGGRRGGRSWHNLKLDLPKHEAGAPSAPNIGARLTRHGSMSLAEGAGASAASTAGNGISSDCQPTKYPDCFRLSADIEELLWKSAFGFEGYPDARKCLLPTVSGVEKFPNSSQSASERDSTSPFSSNYDLHQTFKPNKRVNARTTEIYKHFHFRSTMALVHLRLTPDPEVEEDGLLSPEQLRDKVSGPLVDLFKWLTGEETGEKKVKRILMLVVEDNPACPCSEATVRECLCLVGDIRYLDWRRPNISATTLAVSKNVVEVWLYSTGINAVLCGWADMGGLQTLKQLRVVHIDAKQGVETKEANANNITNFKDRLRKWYANDASRTAPDVKDTYESTGVTSRGRGAQVGSGGDNEKPLNAWLDDIAKFAGRLQPETNAAQGQVKSKDSDGLGQVKDPDFVKLAIIDDGVEPEWEGSSNRGGSGDLGFFLSGHGYPPDMSNWAVAGRRRHGNRMATLITTVCPFVSLYVAKIDSTPSSDQKHPTFDVEQATKAIRWAINEQVEVISMSWNVLLSPTDTRKQALEDALNDANRAGILMFCAAREDDEVSSVNEAWPSAHTYTFSIGAAHIYLGQKGTAGRDAQFFFPSQAVLDDVVNGGTSAATALAAGLASIFVYSLKKNQRNKLHDDEDKKKAARDEKAGQDKNAVSVEDDRAGKESKAGSHDNKQKVGDVRDAGNSKAVEPRLAGQTLLSQATDGSPRAVVLETFERLSKGESAGVRKYVDVGVLTSWNTVSTATISEYCTSHLTKKDSSEKARRNMNRK